VGEYAYSLHVPQGKHKVQVWYEICTPFTESVILNIQSEYLRASVTSKRRNQPYGDPLVHYFLTLRAERIWILGSNVLGYKVRAVRC
jgi:hypothetical protein